MIALMAILALAPVLCASDGGAFLAQRTTISLNRVTNKTGWILLGDLNKDGTRWASAGDPSVDFFSGVFELLDRHVGFGRPHWGVP